MTPTSPKLLRKLGHSRPLRRNFGLVLAVALVAAACSKDAKPPKTPESPEALKGEATEGAAEAPAPPPGPAPTPAAPPRGGLYAATTRGLAPSVTDIPSRIYVPNSDGGTVSILDPATGEVQNTFPVGRLPHHVTPSWDMQTLYVLDTEGDTITPIDPRTATPGAPIPVIDPYNLYFTPDGSTAIVVAERYRRLDLRDPNTWELRTSIPIDPAGVNHADFSPDGRYFYASCEFSGHVVKVDLVEQRVVVDVQPGIQPIDIKLSPDGSVLYVADQARNGVMLLNPNDLSEMGFIDTGRGAHGLYFSRDVSQLYVSNRLNGTVSVIDVASNTVVANWEIPGGGSPDMGGVSIDGTRFWLSGRYHDEVYVFDTATGQLVNRIATGAGPHGLAVFPQPGSYSMGHTGAYR